jgi:hypothetical protein
MTPERDFTSILANLSRQRPTDLDPVLFKAPKSGALQSPSTSGFAPASSLWTRAEDGPSYIGLRIKSPLEHPERMAARLAAIALERQIHPIFISYISKSGLQQFGFRVEQLSGLSEEAQQHYEAQLKRFWRLALIIDASEIDLLG